MFPDDPVVVSTNLLTTIMYSGLLSVVDWVFCLLFFCFQIMEHYSVADFHTAPEFLSLLARRQGKLRKGGLPDCDKAAKSILMDWTGWVLNLRIFKCMPKFCKQL